MAQFSLAKYNGWQTSAFLIAFLCTFLLQNTNKKVLVAVFASFLLVAGCSNNEDPNPQETENQEQNEQSQEIKQNEELTKQVRDEKGCN